MRRGVVALACVGAAIVAIACPLRYGPPPPPPADNELCFVCHIDFSGELITDTHARAGIGCVHCHGPSDDHMANEENVIPPDIMFECGDVNGLCHVCHEPLSAAHPLVNLAAATTTGVCTACHGAHRVSEPRRRWDKRTRELL